MTVLAQVRPDSWNFPLFLHVGGAMILVGAVLTSASALLVARGDGRLLRMGYRALLIVGLPGYILMRVGAEWIADKEGFNAKGAPEPTWLGIGYSVADGSAVLLLIALIVGGIGASRVRKGRAARGCCGRRWSSPSSSSSPTRSRCGRWPASWTERPSQA